MAFFPSNYIPKENLLLKCVAVREKCGKDAKRVIEKIDQQINGSQLDKHPRYCNCSKILRKMGGGIKALYCEMTTKLQDLDWSFFRSVPGEICKKSKSKKR